MSSISVLTWMMLVPLLGAIFIAAVPKDRGEHVRSIALSFSLVTLVLALVAWWKFDPTSAAQFQLSEVRSWIPAFGVSYAVGVDGTALALIVMSAILTPVCLLAAWKDVPEGGQREKTYFALMLLLEAFMVGVFAATDVFLFYVFFEAMLIPVYFLIGLFGGERRQYSAVKFLLFSLAGGLVMLVAVLALYFHGPGGADGFLVEKLTGAVHGSEGAKQLMFLGFFIAFAVKAPMWPVHTWLPDAAEQARPATSVLLVGVLDKVGTFGMIRYCLQLFPEAAKWATPVIITLAVISVLYGALLAISQTWGEGRTDIMRLIAYTSISHFGFIVLGIFAMTSTAGAGSALYMVNHGFSTAGLFLLAGFLVTRGGTQRIANYGGWQRVTPVLAGTFLVAGLSSLALPGLSSFVSEFLVLQGTFQRYRFAAVVATLGIVLAALYILLMYQRVFTGEKPQFAGGAAPGDLSWREKAVVVPIIASFLVLGFYPKPVLDLVNPSVAKSMELTQVTDPVRVVPGSIK